jgi:hypothetical protein
MFGSPVIALNVQCALSKYQSVATAQEIWQRAIATQIISVSPHLKDVTNQYLSDQLLLIEMNRIAVEALLTISPDKLRLDAPVTQWVALSATDKEAISRSNKRYAEMLKQVDVSAKRPPHPNGDELRALMRERISRSSEYQTQLAKLNEVIVGANSRVCR